MLVVKINPPEKTQAILVVKNKSTNASTGHFVGEQNKYTTIDWVIVEVNIRIPLSYYLRYRWGLESSEHIVWVLNLFGPRVAWLVSHTPPP